MEKIYNVSGVLLKSCYEIANKDLSLSESARLLKQEFDRFDIKTIGDDKKETSEWKEWSKTLMEIMSTCLNIKLTRAAYLGNGCDENYLKSPAYRFKKNS